MSRKAIPGLPYSDTLERGSLIGESLDTVLVRGVSRKVIPGLPYSDSPKVLGDNPIRDTRCERRPADLSLT